MIAVTAAVLERGGKILLARRKPGGALAGKWEFPGGKLEPGETPEACLKRELAEEFEIETRIGEHLSTSIHVDTDRTERTIRLMAYRVTYIGGAFRLNAHDAIAWVEPHRLRGFDLAPADVPLLDDIVRVFLPGEGG